MQRHTPRASSRAPWLWASLATAASLGLAGTANATLTVYTTQSSFLAAVSGTATDSFNNLPAGTSASPLSRQAGSYGYTLSVLPDTQFIGDGSHVPPGLVYAAGSAADTWLSTNAATDTLRFAGLSGLRAIGGLFFGSDVDGLFQSGASLSLVATDSGGSITRTLSNPGTTTFLGFVSDGPLVSLNVSATQPAFGSTWVAVNDLTLAAPVPEPQTYLLMLAGLGVVAGMARRRLA
jgi:hypothetical protein